MIRLEYQILAAVVLDLLAGDPRWLPHPVRLIGWVAMAFERPTRWAFRHPRLAGVVTALGVIGLSGAAAYGLLYGARLIHPLAADLLVIVLIYTCLAARDLAAHSRAVFRALADEDLPEARRRVGLIVGRDTDPLDEAGVARATVESVAENLVDGVTAPLLFATLLGPVGAIVYKAINTLDSTFGYKNERYLQFGWASARIDDVANYVPARLTAPLVVVAAWLLRERPGQSWHILRRDGHKHTSPNAGQTEAAMAGALGIQLGGPSLYFGSVIEKPTLGDPSVETNRTHIRRANALMYATSALFAVGCLGLRALGDSFWQWSLWQWSLWQWGETFS